MKYKYFILLNKRLALFCYQMRARCTCDSIIIFTVLLFGGCSTGTNSDPGQICLVGYVGLVGYQCYICVKYIM